jgi:hypothetical protein
MMIAEKNATLRRQFMELLKELTEIIGSGDEQSLSRLRETVRAPYMKVGAKPRADSTEFF